MIVGRISFCPVWMPSGYAAKHETPSSWGEPKLALKRLPKAPVWTLADMACDATEVRPATQAMGAAGDAGKANAKFHGPTNSQCGGECSGLQASWGSAG